MYLALQLHLHASTSGTSQVFEIKNFANTLYVNLKHIGYVLEIFRGVDGRPAWRVVRCAVSCPSTNIKSSIILT